jgi:hypothetical protein
MVFPATRWRRLSLCLIACATVARVAGAQTFEPDPSAADRVHLGNFSFTPAIVFSTGYDTNPYREPGRGPAYETYATPQVSGWLNGAGTNRVAVWGAAEIVRFSNLVPATNWQVGTRAERVGATFQPYFRYNLRNTNANPTGFEVGYKSMRIEGDFLGGADFHFGGFSVAGSVRSTNTNWAADAIYQGSNLRESLNRRSNAARGGVGYSLTPLTSLDFAVEATTDRFVYSPLRDGNGALFLGGLTLSNPAVIQGSAWVGYRVFHSPTDGAADFSGPVGSATLVYARPSGGFLSLRAQRDLQFSYDTSLAYYISTNVNLTGVIVLGDRLKLQGVVATSKLDYRPAGSDQPGPLDRVNELNGAIGFIVGQVTVVGITAEWANAIGAQGWQAFRIVGFVTYGLANGAYQRLDRPIPFSR